MLRNFLEPFNKILAFCKEFSGKLVNEYGNVPRRGPKPRVSDLEIIALGLLAETLMLDSESYFCRLLEKQKAHFQNLISRRQFNERRKLTANLCEQIRKKIAQRLDGRENIFCIDSKPIPVCRNSRAKRSKLECYDYAKAPRFGYCASQKMYYFGYKLHVLNGISGVIHSYEITPANIDDREILKELKHSYINSTIIGDKGYLCAEIQADLFHKHNIKLEVPYRKNQKDTKPQFRLFKRKRKRVETTFSQLTDQFNIHRNYAKHREGFFTRIIHKISAFTISQYMNFLKNQPLCRVKYAAI